MIYTLSYAAFTCALVLSSYSVEYCFVALIAASILGMASQANEEPCIHGLIPSIISVVAIGFSFYINEQLSIYLYTALVLSAASLLGHVITLLRNMDISVLKDKFSNLKKGVKRRES